MRTSLVIATAASSAVASLLLGLYLGGTFRWFAVVPLLIALVVPLLWPRGEARPESNPDRERVTPRLTSAIRGAAHEGLQARRAARRIRAGNTR